MQDFAQFIQLIKNQKNFCQNYNLPTNFDSHAQFRTAEAKKSTFKGFLQLHKQFNKNNKIPNSLNVSGQNPFQRMNRKANFSPKFFSSLKQIVCRELIFNQVNKNKFIKLKIAFSPFVLSSIHVLGQDSEGSYIQFSVYNFPLGQKTASAFFIVGEYVFIKEPFFKKGSDNVFIRIDNPEDIIFQKELAIQQKQKIASMSLFQQIKTKGKDFILKNNYINAYIIYKEGLNLIQLPQQKAVLMMNKAICCKELNLQKEYIECCESALLFDSKNIKKPIYHKIKYKIIHGQKIQEDKSIFTKEEIKQLNNFQEYIQDIRKGIFDWKRIIINKELTQFKNDIFQFRKGKHGIGGFANQFIKQGTFLMFQQAMMFHLGSYEANKQNDLQKLDNRGIFNDKIYQLTIESPQFMKKIKKLCRKNTNNLSFQQRMLLPDLTREQVIDAINTNCFLTTSLQEQIISKLGSVAPQEMYCLFEQISLFNHCCQQNCDYFCVGPYMILYAARDIQQKQELFICYDIQKNREDKIFLKRGFQCNCDYCKDLLNQSSNSQKMKIIKCFRTNFQPLNEEQIMLMLQSSKMIGLRALLLYVKNKEPAKQFLKRLLNINNEDLMKIFWHCTEVQRKRIKIQNVISN